jgi:hypothetical protein
MEQLKIIEAALDQAIQRGSFNMAEVGAIINAILELKEKLDVH